LFESNVARDDSWNRKVGRVGLANINIIALCSDIDLT